MSVMLWSFVVLLRSDQLGVCNHHSLLAMRLCHVSRFQIPSLAIVISAESNSKSHIACSIRAGSCKLLRPAGSKIRLAAQPSPTKSSRSKALPAQAPPAGSQRDRSGPANAADATAEPAAAGLTQEQVWEQELWQEIALKRAAAR